MKDICLCIVKETDEVHSIGIINDEGKYYLEEFGGFLELNRNPHLFIYKEFTWKEFSELIKVGLENTI